MDGSPGVWILGGHQSDFARNLTKDGHDFAAMPATVCDGLWDTPASRHEAACASGGAATLATMADLRSGAYDTALVVGIELEKTVPGDTAAQHLGAAAWTGHEGDGARYLWPSMFARVADEHDRRYGLDDAHLGLTGPGESWKAIENGEIEIGGRLPINPSGGLIGGGHPVGASGVRMLLDAAKQVSGAAGDYQIDGAQTFGTLNFGGTTATTVSFVVSKGI